MKVGEKERGFGGKKGGGEGGNEVWVKGSVLAECLPSISCFGNYNSDNFGYTLRYKSSTLFESRSVSYLYLDENVECKVTRLGRAYTGSVNQTIFIFR